MQTSLCADIFMCRHLSVQTSLCITSLCIDISVWASLCVDISLCRQLYVQTSLCVDISLCRHLYVQTSLCVDIFMCRHLSVQTALTLDTLCVDIPLCGQLFVQILFVSTLCLQTFLIVETLVYSSVDTLCVQISLCRHLTVQTYVCINICIYVDISLSDRLFVQTSFDVTFRSEVGSRPFFDASVPCHLLLLYNAVCVTAGFSPLLNASSLFRVTRHRLSNVHNFFHRVINYFIMSEIRSIII